MSLELTPTPTLPTLPTLPIDIIFMIIEFLVTDIVVTCNLELYRSFLFANKQFSSGANKYLKKRLQDVMASKAHHDTFWQFWKYKNIFSNALFPLNASRFWKTLMEKNSGLGEKSLGEVELDEDGEEFVVFGGKLKSLISLLQNVEKCGIQSEPDRFIWDGESKVILGSKAFYTRFGFKNRLFILKDVTIINKSDQPVCDAYDIPFALLFCESIFSPKKKQYVYQQRLIEISDVKAEESRFEEAMFGVETMRRFRL